MFVSHIAELSDAHLYFTKFRKFLGALPPLEKSLATPLVTSTSVAGHSNVRRSINYSMVSIA